MVDAVAIHKNMDSILVAPSHQNSTTFTACLALADWYKRNTNQLMSYREIKHNKNERISTKYLNFPWQTFTLDTFTTAAEVLKNTSFQVLIEDTLSKVLLSDHSMHGF